MVCVRGCHGQVTRRGSRASLHAATGRDPDGEGQIWCYTTDPDVRWEFCEDPTSPVEVEEWVDFVQPTPNAAVARISVTACFHHDGELGAADIGLAHMRTEGFDLMLELGDNVYVPVGLHSDHRPSVGKLCNAVHAPGAARSMVLVLTVC